MTDFSHMIENASALLQRFEADLPKGTTSLEVAAAASMLLAGVFSGAARKRAEADACDFEEAKNLEIAIWAGLISNMIDAVRKSRQ